MKKKLIELEIQKIQDNFRFIGYSTKANAKRTLVKNFIEGEDYKITVIKSDDGRFSEETILMNTDTFKQFLYVHTRRSR